MYLLIERLINNFFILLRILDQGEKVALNKSNLLLRGCTVRNTDFIEGIVVYAGTCTFLFLCVNFVPHFSN